MGKIASAILTRPEVPSKQRDRLIGSVLDKGLAGWVSRHRQMGLIADTETDDRWVTVVVTAGTWIALDPIAITPIIRLRNDLIGAGEAISKDAEPPDFYSVTVQRQDELGDVISAFNQIFVQITEAISDRKQAEAALQGSLNKVEEYSQKLNCLRQRGRCSTVYGSVP
ncbi:MAG: hypothetical protein GDA38_18325 [Hormoscilla sp. SP12CHS1]|nr:hypothetical protein [Hormoscilla sp. SP12CHS1]